MPHSEALGIILHDGPSARRTDFLYRVSLKCLVRNENGEVLVVKENGRDWWDLPGGGMNHGEDISHAIAREMKEEVNLEGAFTYKIVAVDEPAHLKAQNFWQIRLIFEVKPRTMLFSAGHDGDKVAFMKPDIFKDAKIATERCIYEYCQLTLTP